MSVQLTFVAFLFLTINGLCSDADQAKEAIDEEILSSLFTSEVQQSRHSTPLWQVPLFNMCRMLARVSEPLQDDWYGSKVQLAYDQKVSTAVSQTSQELYDLLTLCRVLQPREVDQEFLEVDQSSDRPLKRKSPYILKRQLYNKKARRPYILKRSFFY
ncbi:neurotensin/neuromedin N [Clarias gariepinus]|uniref:neurotensin/neuromedin N n=1 Tax=Clarias gariepinus TaxID=13013 RepID=UPI00234E1EFC|nr:neurotensin/neuromedin N [Clarias gariepinus]